MYLIFDTETTGFPNSKLSPQHPQQARVCSIAMLLMDDNFEEVSCFSSLVKPRGWEIPNNVSMIHGITTEDCHRYGIAMDNILQVFEHYLSKAKLLAAHNIKFDNQMLHIEYDNSLVAHKELFMIPQQICTMQLMTPICKLLGGKFGNQYKWPKLIEAYQYLFKKSFEGAHNALADVRATAEILKWLIDNNKVGMINATSEIATH